MSEKKETPAASQAVERVMKLLDRLEVAAEYTDAGAEAHLFVEPADAEAVREVLAALASAERASREKDDAIALLEAVSNTRITNLEAQLDTLRASLAEAIKERDELKGAFMLLYTDTEDYAKLGALGGTALDLAWARIRQFIKLWERVSGETKVQP